MSNDESEQNLEQQNIEKQETQKEQLEETKKFREAELPPTPQDIDMPTVKPPKEDSEE